MSKISDFIVNFNITIMVKSDFLLKMFGNYIANCTMY